MNHLLPRHRQPRHYRNSALAIPGVILPLPTLPLPMGTLVAAHGDSQTAFNHVAVSGENAVSTSAAGPVQAALALDPFFNFDAWYSKPAPYTDLSANPIAEAGPWLGSNTGIAGDRFV